ncbi:MAG: hypothetical protein KDE31_08950, partial [Caldilineaceae bacterium]|nr:hypothetical protein [Caldilineaceae bacterium]
MVFVEVVVNRPIRRTFRQAQSAVIPDPTTDPGAGAQLLLSDLDVNDSDSAALVSTSLDDDSTVQLFHYHLPPALESTIVPGHLVWVPFGAQQVQGVVVRHASASPVPTRAVLRLARSVPVLTPIQLALAAWIADYYVAPLSEAVKLFF